MEGIIHDNQGANRGPSVCTQPQPLLVIIYSAHIDASIEKEGLAAGASAVVSKYDAVADMIGKVRELLDEIAGLTTSFPSPGI